MNINLFVYHKGTINVICAYHWMYITIFKQYPSNQNLESHSQVLYFHCFVPSSGLFPGERGGSVLAALRTCYRKSPPLNGRFLLEACVQQPNQYTAFLLPR